MRSYHYKKLITKFMPLLGGYMRLKLERDKTRDAEVTLDLTL
jgi:hypothetical protein